VFGNSLVTTVGEIAGTSHNEHHDIRSGGDMLLILRTTCCEHEWVLSDVVSSHPAVSTQLQQQEKKNACNAFPKRPTYVIHIPHAPAHPTPVSYSVAHLRLLPTRLLPVKGFSAPLPLEVGKVIEFLGLRECWFLVFWSRWLVCAFLVEVFESTSMLVSVERKRAR
jgi:hypothetical protein